MLGELEPLLDALDATGEGIDDLAVAAGECVKAAEGLLDGRQPQLNAIQSVPMVAQGSANGTEVLENEILDIVGHGFSSDRAET
jgi:hypothetical protein